MCLWSLPCSCPSSWICIFSSCITELSIGLTFIFGLHLLVHLDKLLLQRIGLLDHNRQGTLIFIISNLLLLLGHDSLEPQHLLPDVYEVGFVGFEKFLLLFSQEIIHFVLQVVSKARQAFKCVHDLDHLLSVLLGKLHVERRGKTKGTVLMLHYS